MKKPGTYANYSGIKVVGLPKNAYSGIKLVGLPKNTYSGIRLAGIPLKCAKTI